MNFKHLTNDQVMTTDFSERERKTFLRSVSTYKPKKSHHRQYGMSMSGVWMTDVSIMDRRSVKAQLAGRGDYRAKLWAISCALHRFFKPHSTLAQRMYRFHSRHHAMTLFVYQTRHDYCQLYRAVKHHGLVAGMRCAAMQMTNAGKEQP